MSFMQGFLPFQTGGKVEKSEQFLKPNAEKKKKKKKDKVSGDKVKKDKVSFSNCETNTIYGFEHIVIFE